MNRRTARRSLLLLVLATAVAVVAFAGWRLASSGSAAPAQASSPGLAARVIDAGGVEVTVTPASLESTGVTLGVVLDTHSGSLDIDPATQATATVNGLDAGRPQWRGPGPGGHHIEGSLEFTTPIPSGSTIVLTLTGLPQPVQATWTAP
jgi:hypothetical protein